MLNLSVSDVPCCYSVTRVLGAQEGIKRFLTFWPWGQQWTKRKREFQGSAEAWSWNLVLCGCFACAGYLQNARPGNSWRECEIFLLFWDMCIFITFCLGDSICWFGLVIGKHWCFRTCRDRRVEMSLRKQAMQNKHVCVVYIDDKVVNVCLASRCSGLTLAGCQSHSITPPSKLKKGEKLCQKSCGLSWGQTSVAVKGKVASALGN